MAEKKFNGRTFKTESMLATKAMVMQARLIKAAGPAVAHLGEILQGQGAGATVEQKARSDARAILALTEIFKGMEPEAFADLVKDVVETAMIKRPSGHYESVDFDGDFTNYQKDIIPVVGWILKEQFGDFFTGLLETGNRDKAPQD